jgi:hypothetical protein
MVPLALTGVIVTLRLPATLPTANVLTSVSNVFTDENQATVPPTDPAAASINTPRAGTTSSDFFNFFINIFLVRVVINDKNH